MYIPVIFAMVPAIPQILYFFPRTPPIILLNFFATVLTIATVKTQSEFSETPKYIITPIDHVLESLESY